MSEPGRRKRGSQKIPGQGMAQPPLSGRARSLVGAAFGLALRFGATLIGHFLTGTLFRLVAGLVAGAFLLPAVAHTAD